MAKTDMNTILKRRMAATQQASELQASDEAYGEDKIYHLEAWTRYPEDVPVTGESKNAWQTGTHQP